MKIIKKFSLILTDNGDLVVSYIINGIENKYTYTPADDDPETSEQILTRVRNYHEDTF